MESILNQQPLLTNQLPTPIQSIPLLKPIEFESIEDPYTRQSSQV